MTPEQIKALIDQLLQTGEVLSTKAFELAMRQIYLMAGLDAFFGLLFLIASVVLFFHWRKQNAVYNSDYYTYSRHEQAGTLRWVFGLFLLFSMFAFLVEFGFVVSYIVNPQWYAVQLLISTCLGS